MTQKKNRKPLTDTLAQQFVYGENPKDTTPDASQEPTPTQPKEDKTPPRKSDTKRDRSSSKAPSTDSTPSTSEPMSENNSKTLGVKLPSQSRLMDKFQAPSKEATVRFTVDLPISMHRKLSLLAARTGKKKAEIVRVLLDETLKDLEGD